jgi:hypothetical protein
MLAVNGTECDLNQVIAHIYYIQKGARVNQVSAQEYKRTMVSLHQSVKQVSPVAFSCGILVVAHSCHSSP